jgi:hypothetical protein
MQALFDVFLFVLTIFNAASRPRRANVKIITDLRRDGCVFYLVRANCQLSAQLRSPSHLGSFWWVYFCVFSNRKLNNLHSPLVGRFLNVALSIPTSVRLSPRLFTPHSC